MSEDIGVADLVELIDYAMASASNMDEKEVLFNIKHLCLSPNRDSYSRLKKRYDSLPHSSKEHIKKFMEFLGTLINIAAFEGK